MITGSAQTLSAGMNRSLQDYRSYLDKQQGAAARGGASAKNEVGTPENPPPPTTPVEPAEPTRPAPNVDDMEAAAQQRRDSARQAAVYTAELKQPQQLFDTYVNASSNDESETSNTNSIDPAKVYQASMDYSRRTDLLAAFEKAGQEQPETSQLNIVV